MTGKDAIKELKTFKIGAKSELGENALDMAIEALERKPCGEQDIYEKAYKDGYDKGYDDGYFIGKNLWISINEKLPEKSGEYLVTRQINNNMRVVVEIISFAKNLYKIDDFDFYDKKEKAGWFNYASGFGYIEVDGVIAWMPLPPCYKPQESEE